MDAAPSLSPSPELVRTYLMDASPSPPSSPELENSYRIDASPSLPPELACTYRMDATPSPPPSKELGCSHRMDVTPSPPPSTELVCSYHMDRTPSPLPLLNNTLRMDKLPSSESQDDSRTQGHPFSNRPLFGSSPNARRKLYIFSSHMHLSLAHADLERQGRPPFPSNSARTGQPDNVGEVEGMHESVCQPIPVPV